MLYIPSIAEGAYHMKKITLSILALTMVASCAPKHSGSSLLDPLKLLTGKIFSIGQQSETTYVGIIQLKNKALLADALIVDSKAVIADEAKEAINAEQEEMIGKLQALSSDIKIIAQYKLVLNAIAFTAPSKLAGQIEKVDGVFRMLESSKFNRPAPLNTEEKVANLVSDLNLKNTVTFIGADKLHAKGFDGSGMKVGIIDTGIDYTHKMLGGPGTEEAYKSVDPSGKTTLFPNDKVVGGVDFVGTEFNAASEKIENQIPHRDENPIDEAEHGTHVSGTVAGIGDGVNTYSGVAPKAKLYGLKVFGKDGSTSDIAVIQALEYAADITESANPNNHLDVVNLSLGGGFGKPKILYSEAVKNLTRAGTVVVASAGNSGDNPYITGAPGTADDAISIAASIDDLDQNIVNQAIELNIAGTKKVTELIEGDIGPRAHDSKLSGELVYIGNAADPIAEDIKVKVAGKIALIDRGSISFADKFTKAVELGAVGVVVINNKDEAPIPMGGDKKFEIPGVMITKALGAEIKEALKTSAVVVNFASEEVIRHEERIDQITDFSSRGPRSIDSLIKPEIAAPGSNIISAKCGSGVEGVQFSGTSMAAPHMAGVMTILKQAFPNLSVAELKAKVMNTSKILTKGSSIVPVSLQGAGRVQVLEAFNSKVIAMPAALSLGEVSLVSTKAVAKEVTLKNISNEDVLFTSKIIKGKNVTVNMPASFKVKANSEKKIVVSFKLNRANEDANNIETDGFVILNSPDGSSIHLPFLAVLNKVTDLKATELVTQTNSAVDKVGAEVKLKIKNNGKVDGEALVFNLLGTDDKKVVKDATNLSSNTSCDLEAAGIRFIERTLEGKTVKLMQIGVKLFDTLTFWQPCDVSLLIDADGDGVADQELAGTLGNYLPGVGLKDIISVLLDSKIARELRKSHEADNSIEENYIPAILDAQAMKFYDHGSVAIIEADITKLAKGKNGQVGIKLAVTHLESNVSEPDYLASHESKWQKISLSEEAMAFKNIPESVEVKANDFADISLVRGVGNQRMLVLYPHNMPLGSLNHDLEAQILSDKLLKE